MDDDGGGDAGVGGGDAGVGGDHDLVQCDLEEGGGFMHHTCYNEEDLEPYNCKRSKFEISVSLRYNIFSRRGLCHTFFLQTCKHVFSFRILEILRLVSNSAA